MDDDRTALCGVTVALQGIEDRLLQGQADRGKVCGVLGFRVHPDSRAVAAPACAGRQLQDFIEGRHGELSIEGAVLRPQFRQTFPRAQSLEFSQSEIFGKPAAQSFTVDGLCALPCCKFGMLRHIGGAADLILVPGNQHAVARHHQVGLDEIGAFLDREAV